MTVKKKIDIWERGRKHMNSGPKLATFTYMVIKQLEWLLLSSLLPHRTFKLCMFDVHIWGHKTIAKNLGNSLLSLLFVEQLFFKFHQ